MPGFEFAMSIVSHATDIGRCRIAALGIVVGGQVEVCAFAHALLLFDVFDAASPVAGRELRGDAHVFGVGRFGLVVFVCL